MAKKLASFASIPVINAGDGIGAQSEHPTQAFLDIYTMRKEFGSLDNLTILFVGGGHQRTIHSLMYCLMKFHGTTLYIHSPDRYLLPPCEHKALLKAGMKIKRVERLEDAICKVDVIYHNGMSEDAGEHIPEKFKINIAKLYSAQSHLILMHPLPRSGEIAYDVDNTLHARYMQQAWNGIPIRMALLKEILCPPQLD